MLDALEDFRKIVKAWLKHNPDATLLDALRALIDPREEEPEREEVVRQEFERRMK